MKALKTINELLYRAEKALLVCLLLGMVCLSFLQVVLRQFFSAGILWADVFLRHLVLWVGFLGAAVAAQQDKHFAIDMLKKYLPAKARTWAGMAGDLFAVVCLFYLSAASLRFFNDELAARSVLFTIGEREIHSFWINAVFPGGFILLLVHFALRLVQGLVETAAGKVSGSHPA